MNAPRLLFALSLAPVAALHAQAAAPAAELRAGRAAIAANQPAQARDHFAAALAGQGSPEERYAAAIGLGQSTLWLGDYAAADRAFRIARDAAPDDAARQAASTGLAQALNARDYPREARALVAPYAMSQTRPTVELLRAEQALGWLDRGQPYLDAAPAPDAAGYVGTQYRLLKDDVAFNRAAQLEGGFGYSHDSDGLDTWRVGAAYRFAPSSSEDFSQRWGVAAGTTHLDHDGRSRRMDDLSLTAQLRVGEDNTINLHAGPGRANGWHYLQGNADWTLQPSDVFSFSAGAERAPVPTDTAIDHHLLYNLFSAGVSVRPAPRLYVLPTYYRQNFNDGNHRDGGVLRVLLSPYDLPGTRAAIGAEFSGRIFHSSEPSHGVYFNPRNYRSGQFGLVGVYSINPEWKLRAVVSGGRQVIDGNSAGIYTVGLSLQGRLPGNGRLDLQLGRSSAASASNGGSGYWNNSINLVVRYPL
ncbi:hypothetical protein ISN75_14675 [Dyella marensis]|uniref:hypothetical protein n=1 Tax=Dyella marensis TaxID=500610 RepID=UPI0031E2D415